MKRKRDPKQVKTWEVIAKAIMDAHVRLQITGKEQEVLRCGSGTDLPNAVLVLRPESRIVRLDG